MPSQVVFLLPLLGGLWLLYRVNLLRVVTEHIKQPIVVLMSGFLGVWLFLVARLVTHWAHQASAAHVIESSVRRLLPLEFSGTGLAAFALAVCSAELFNWLVPKRNANEWVIKKYGSELLKMLYEAMLAVKPVALTLDNREVYVGFVQSIPWTEAEKLSVRILGLGSGSRDPTTLAPRVVYHSPTPKAQDMLVAIPLDAVRNVTFAIP